MSFLFVFLKITQNKLITNGHQHPQDEQGRQSK